MSPLFVFLCGVGLLALFGVYFAAETNNRKRLAGTVLTILITAFSIWGIKTVGIKKGIDLQGGSAFTVRLNPEIGEDGEKMEIFPGAVDEAIGILRKRLNPKENKDLLLAPQGDDRIIIQMPGISQEEMEDVRKKIEQVAKLEFRMRHPRSDSLVRSVSDGLAFEPGYIVMESRVPQDKNIPQDPPFLVKNRPEMGGEHVTKAFPFYDSGGWAISLTFDGKGGDLFHRMSSDYANERMAIIIDGEIVSTPGFYQGPIAGGKASITGRFTEREARDLANVLQNPLRNKLEIEEDRSVSPTYGEATIKQGFTAGLAGLALTLLFVLFYYRAAGIIALIGLAVNIVLLFGTLALFGFTLTMPGIAGILLTIGISIDANVLIYERLREEMKAGKSLAMAIDAAYDKAFSAIFDANVTTLITATILFMVASGTIKGFAITLTIGILASLFAALLVTRTCYRWLGMRDKLKKLSFANLIPDKTWDILGKRKFTAILSVILVGLALALLGSKGSSAFGPDFTGGDLLTLNVSESQLTQEQIRNALADLKIPIKNDQGLTTAEENLGEYFLQEMDGASGRFFQLRSEFGTAPHIMDELRENVDAELSFTTDRVGPLIGKKLAQNSALALGLGLLGILAYVTMRFEFSFAVGALLALAHDIIITFGVVALSGREISLILVGAFLTIAGYSINDTIVVFDRIRENLRAKRGEVSDIMNRAISTTLSRTLLTSLTTLITVGTLFVFGGPSLQDFAFTIIIGVLIGTYSSLFVASPVVLWWANKRNKNLRREVLDADEARQIALDDPTVG